MKTETGARLMLTVGCLIAGCLALAQSNSLPEKSVLQRGRSAPEYFELRVSLDGVRHHQHDVGWVLPDPAAEVVVVIEIGGDGTFVHGPLLISDDSRMSSVLKQSVPAKLEPVLLHLEFPEDQLASDWALTIDQVWGQPAPQLLRSLLLTRFAADGTASYPGHPDIDIVLDVLRPGAPSFGFQVFPTSLPEGAILPSIDSLELTFVDGAGRPLAGVGLDLTVDSSWWSFYSRGVSDSLGRVALPCVDAAVSLRLDLSLRIDGSVQRPATGTLECPGSRTIRFENERLVADHEPYTAAQVIGSGGEPPPRRLGDLHGKIYGSPPSSAEWVVLAASIGPNASGEARFVTRSEGASFVFSSIPEGEYDVRVFGRRDLEMQVGTDSGDEIAFIAETATSCDVRVLHGGMPLRGARLWLETRNDPVHRGRQRVPVTNSEGRARLDVKTGESLIPYLELLENAGKQFLVLAPIQAGTVWEDCRDELVIVLPESIVHVEVKDGISGSMVRGAVVGVHRITSSEAGESAQGVRAVKGATNSAGALSIPGLAAGRWAIYASADNGQMRAMETVDLREGETLEVELKIVGGAR